MIPAKPKKSFEANLESLRGFAAIIVVFHHLSNTLTNWLDPHYELKGLKTVYFPGHLSVLIFFVLSGYVIGVSHKDGLHKSNVGLYIKKRLVRLYPIYLVSILLTLLVAANAYSITTIISHLSFTQVLLTHVFDENNALWSLNYEVLFYLLFIPVSFFNINPLVLACGTFLIGVANMFFYSSLHTPLISAYAFGFTFWLSGLIIARYFPFKEMQLNYSLLVSNIFLILTFGGGVYNIIIRLFDTLNSVMHNHLVFPSSVDWYKQAITFNDFSLFPYCLVFIIVFTGKHFKYRKMVITFFQLLPLLAIPHIIKAKLSYSDFFLPSMYYVISLLFYFSNFGWFEFISKKIVDFGSWLGGLSYSLYVIHLPILFAFSRINFFSGSGFTYVFRIVVYFTIIILLSYILEKKVQPQVRNLFFKNNIGKAKVSVG